MRDIVVGRTPEDMKKFGTDGTAFIGKHIVGKGDEARLTNKVMLDVLRPHLILICGKRGTGKSYAGGVIAEEIALLPEEFRKNLTVVMIDTMGIYWSTKLANDNQIDSLNNWKLQPKGLEEIVKVYVPYKQKEEFEAAGVPADFGVSIAPHEFSGEEWSLAFNLPMTNPISIALQRTVNSLHERNEKFEVDDIIAKVKDSKFDTHTKTALDNMLSVADKWGVFGEVGIPIEQMMKPGLINVFDVSHLRATQAWSVRNLLVALLSREIYQKRLVARKKEEVAKLEETELKERYPMVWVIMDEAHQFIPAGTKTASTDPILTIVKQGREPGISFVPMTQRPNKLHPDVVSQTDIVISHRLTSQDDLKALRAVMQSYMAEDLQKYIDSLPKDRGTAIILDDTSERIYSLQVRPRYSWHAGESAVAVE